VGESNERYFAAVLFLGRALATGRKRKQRKGRSFLLCFMLLTERPKESLKGEDGFLFMKTEGERFFPFFCYCDRKQGRESRPKRNRGRRDFL